MSILHIAQPQKFTKPFFLYVQNNFRGSHHSILSYSVNDKWPSGIKIESSMLSGVEWFSNFAIKASKSNKIVVHGLSDGKVILALFALPWLLKKSYWVIMGSDLYAYQSDVRTLKWRLKEVFRKSVIAKMGHLVTYVEGDVELARRWYGARGVYHNSIMYTSNVYRECDSRPKVDTTINIQVGNSADSSNRHVDVLKRLLPFKHLDIRIYVPLSYGDEQYAAQVIEEGERLFGKKIIPMTDFMPVDQYVDFLSEIDIAIFNHKRQQAMGNIINLLGMGKKVFLCEDVTPWHMFKKMGIKVYSASDIELSKMDSETERCNRQLIKDKFSERNLFTQLDNIFGE